VSGTPTVVNHLKYSAFGSVTSETNAAVDHLLGFTGRERDEESGLDYYRARFYDSGLGQFVSEDPIEFEAGDANLRRYLKNGPTWKTDPSGLEERSLTKLELRDKVGAWRQGEWRGHFTTRYEAEHNRFYIGKSVTKVHRIQDAYDAYMNELITRDEFIAINAKDANLSIRGQYEYSYRENDVPIIGGGVGALIDMSIQRWDRAERVYANHLDIGESSNAAATWTLYFYAADTVGVADLSHLWEIDDPTTAEALTDRENFERGISGLFGLSMEAIGGNAIAGRPFAGTQLRLGRLPKHIRSTPNLPGGFSQLPEGQRIAAATAEGFPNYQCVRCAEAISEALTERGIPHKRIVIETHSRSFNYIVEKGAESQSIVSKKVKNPPAKPVAFEGKPWKGVRFALPPEEARPCRLSPRVI
jgi:RHS repeat-associated protein